ncbi:MAG: photosynthetic reaction center subunit M, partial [Myxococcota bacterium]
MFELKPDYQNIFTQIQVRGELDPGVPIKEGIFPRVNDGFFSHLVGRIGNAQFGPVYLGWLGVLSVVFFSVAFLIIGMNMWASVGFSPVQFIRQLPWLALDPPPPSLGLSWPPLNQGGWFLITGMFLSASIFLWWGRCYLRARALGLGTHVSWAFLSAIWLYMVLGFFRPIAMGSWGEAVPYGIFPHLD